MSPAESINCITIGATHSDNTTISRNDIRFNPYSSIMPSTYTSFGSGHKNAIKPDIVYDGGRQMYETRVMQRLLLEPTKYKRIPGICVARPDSTLNNVIYNIGTSNSCALMTRNGSICHDVIKDLIQDHQIADTYTSILIKAMLTHGCSWDNIGNNIRSKLNNNLDTYSVKRVITNWIGYGYPDIEKVLECTPQRATVIGVGELNDEGAHVYSFPLPPSLSPHRVKRRLTITLAWMTPISSISYKYRRAKLWFEPSNNEIARNRIYYNDKAVKRGTLQHEIFEGDDARAFVDGDNIKIKVNCTKEASSFEDAIKYALIVSLEVAEGLNYPIYQEVKDRIRIPIPIEEFSI